MQKKWWKKMMVAGLAAAAMVVAGCGDDKAGTSAGDGNSYRYGLVTAVTGPAATYGKAIEQGTKLAIEEINAKSKLKIDLFMEDAGGDKNQAINAVNKLIHNDNVLVIQGPMLSGEMLAAAPVGQQNGVPMLGTSTTAEGITDAGDYIFRNAVPESLALPIALRKAHDVLHYQNVVIMYSSNNDQMVSAFRTIQDELKKLNVNVAGVETFADKDTDFSAQLTKVKALHPDLLIVAALYQEGALILKKAREMGMNMPVLGGNGFNSPGLVAQAGAAADGVVVGSPWWPAKGTEKVKNFLANYKAKYGEEPDQFAAQAYDAVYLYHQAVENAGTTTDRAKVRDALAHIKNFEGVTGKFEFDENRNPKMDINVLTLKNGKFEEFK